MHHIVTKNRNVDIAVTNQKKAMVADSRPRDHLVLTLVIVINIISIWHDKLAVIVCHGSLVMAKNEFCC